MKKKNNNNNNSRLPKNDKPAEKKEPSFNPIVFEMKSKPKMILSKDLMAQVNYLHRAYPGKEWSGILFYSSEGKITSPGDMVVKADRLMLKDLGTAAYTEYSFDEDIIDFYDEFPHTEEMKIGHIHTHHSMDNYFSATDKSELNDNSRRHNYYISLIVSYNCKYSAKMAIYSKDTKHTSSILDDNGKDTDIDVNIGECVYYYDFDIEVEVDDFTINKLKELEKENKKSTALIPFCGSKTLWDQDEPSYPSYPNYSGYGSYSQNNTYDYEASSYKRFECAKNIVTDFVEGCLPANIMDSIYSKESYPSLHSVLTHIAQAKKEDIEEAIENILINEDYLANMVYKDIEESFLKKVHENIDFSSYLEKAVKAIKEDFDKVMKNYCYVSTYNTEFMHALDNFFTEMPDDISFFIDQEEEEEDGLITETENK